MNDELEILQCLIENRIFAPSPSALAKRLAYKGKMTIYRVMEGKVSFRVVHDVWRKLLKESISQMIYLILLDGFAISLNFSIMPSSPK